jgi:hypothetical protein
MKDFNFGEVLTRAWQIVWKYKVLWVFGILASCGQGSSSGSNGSGSRNNFNQPNFNLPPQALEWIYWIEENTAQFVMILLAVVCIIWIVTVFLSTIGRIGLIRGTAQAEGGAESLILGQLFSESMPYFWRMFGLQLIFALPVILFAVLVSAAVVMGVASGNNPTLAMFSMIPLLLACCCLFVPVMFVLGIIFRQSERAIVLEELSVMPSLSRGWEVFRANLGPIILMAVILAVIGFVVGMAVAVPIFIIVVPATMSYLAGGGESNSPLILMAVCICLYIPIAWLLQGIATAYVESAWTLTYMRLTNNPPTAEDNQPSQSDDPNRTLLASSPNA